MLSVTQRRGLRAAASALLPPSFARWEEWPAPCFALYKKPARLVRFTSSKEQDRVEENIEVSGIGYRTHR